ncbi:Hypothetical protein CAP_7033 [Chondromyces apiculatus DSM 436]|uniref:Uncharacterized protein n=1 Tax=Chondromyces apiculatus DSM 436 TaxID=1192034 RepID=A0A017THD9_9BACT|nr:Hypothetical protein CAP_7033 [Chondromyces apiculatus DSM 436]
MAFSENEAPPLRGKENFGPELSDAVPTLDDDVRSYRHHPNEAGSIVFDVNPHAGDAAADLASELGAEFLEGATRAQDVSDLHMMHEEMDPETAYIHEEELLSDSDELAASDASNDIALDIDVSDFDEGVEVGDEVELGSDIRVAGQAVGQNERVTNVHVLKRPATMGTPATEPSLSPYHRRASGQR